MARLIRITLHGEDLADLTTLGPTDHLKLAVPADPSNELELPTVKDGRIHFAGARATTRDYTIRKHRPDLNEIDVEIAVHDGGHVSSWAERTHVGAVVGTMGPRGSHPMPRAENYVLIGDLSSLPAISRWAEELPAGTSAQVLVATGESNEVLDFSGPANVEAHWVHRSSGVAADELPTALDLVDFSRPDLYVWAAGEVLAMRQVRDRLADRVDHLSIDGYWRRGEADFDHHGSIDG